MKQLWRLWAKALGEKASLDNREADLIAIIRSLIVLTYIVTNIIIILGVIRHWNDGHEPKKHCIPVSELGTKKNKTGVSSIRLSSNVFLRRSYDK